MSLSAEALVEARARAVDLNALMVLQRDAAEYSDYEYNQSAGIVSSVALLVSSAWAVVQVVLLAQRTEPRIASIVPVVASWLVSSLVLIWTSRLRAAGQRHVRYVERRFDEEISHAISDIMTVRETVSNRDRR
jgi:hypothetical protein